MHSNAFIHYICVGSLALTIRLGKLEKKLELNNSLSSLIYEVLIRKYIGLNEGFDWQFLRGCVGKDKIRAVNSPKLEKLF